MSKDDRPQKLIDKLKQIAAWDPKTGTWRMLTRADGSAIDKPRKK